MTKTWFVILSVFSVLFFSGAPTAAQEINVGDSIFVCGKSEVFLASTKAIGRIGPAKKLSKYLVSVPIEGKIIHIIAKYNDTQFLIGLDKQDYLLSVGNPQIKDFHNGDYHLNYFHKSFVDSLRIHYFEQPFYRSNGEPTRFTKMKYDDGLEFLQEIWYPRTGTELRPYAASIKPGVLNGDGSYTAYKHLIDDGLWVRGRKDMEKELDSIWPLTSVDSLRNHYVGDTLILGVNLYDVRDSIDIISPSDIIYTSSRLKSYKKYNKVVVDSIYVNWVRQIEEAPMHLEYRVMLEHATDNNAYKVSLSIDDVNYPHLFVSPHEYDAYLEEQRLLEEKRKEYIALSAQEWIAQQRELDEHEQQMLKIFTAVYGEELGLDIWWGRLKFGYTEEMCKNAFRNNGMYRIKDNVDTPLGPARRIHFIQSDIILYFINDRLVGVVIYGETTWGHVF